MTDAAVMSDEFRKYLERITKDRELLVDNFENIRPFFVFADSGQYGRIVHPEGRDVQHAIATATGTGVSKVIGLPIENTKLTRRYVDTYELSLLTVLNDRYYDRLVGALGRHTEDILSRISYSDFGKKLRASLPEDIRNTLWNSIHPPLFYYLGFTVAGEKILALQLEPLVKMLPAIVPLRQHRSKTTSTWFVTCM